MKKGMFWTSVFVDKNRVFRSHVGARADTMTRDVCCTVGSAIRGRSLFVCLA